ncbi:MAG: ABC transporter ATP-binding protein [Hyphomicrobiales bacterium]|nr:ABC transporter ATP-binding protein [Hyphomicrobiales bacterium]
MERKSKYLLELDGLTKTFPGVVANDGVSFQVGHGEIHALLGENGAGKSTLVKMIYGVLQPDAGVMHLHGETYAPANPSAARAHGLGMVFQHFLLFDALSVIENIELGIAPELARGDLRSRIVEVSDYYGLKLDPDRLVGELSVGQRQRVEIVRCLLQNPRLIIMDEPTSVLTPQEVEVLFRTLRQLAEEGCSILYISHKLEEIRALCHKATVLRGGKVVAECSPAQETAKSLAEMMIGAVVVPARRAGAMIGAERLRLNSVHLDSTHQFGVSLKDVSLSVRGGEILGIAGVAGNGQEELMEFLIGERLTRRADSIVIGGVEAGRKGPDARRALGMCTVPEERLGHAAVPGMSLVENTILSARVRKQLARSGIIDYSRTQAFAQDIIAGFDVRTPGADRAARSLSGGNLQKFIMGREILQDPDVLVACQPTWGVDAGAAAAIHGALIGLAKNGAAIVVISQDLDELLAISDRICVIANGALSEPEAIADVTMESIGRKMGGPSAAEQTNAGSSDVSH